MEQLKLYIIFILLITISCENNTIKTHYENANIKEIYRLKKGLKNGIYKSFYPNNKIKELSFFENGIYKDSSLYYANDELNSIKKIIYYNLKKDTLFVKDFFIENKLKGKGYQLKNGNKIGNWEFYNYNGFIQRKVEFININGLEYANRTYEYDSSGKLINGNFYEFMDVKDTIKKNEFSPFTIYLTAPFFSYDSEILMLVPSGDLVDLQYLIENRNEIKFDTITTEKDLPNLFLTLDIGFSKPGKKRVSGIIVEKCPKNIDSIPKGSMRELFFEKEIFVR